MSDLRRLAQRTRKDPGTTLRYPTLRKDDDGWYLVDQGRRVRLGPATAAGVVMFDNDILDGGVDDRAVVFPEGLFTAPPSVTVTPYMAGTGVSSVRFGVFGSRDLTADGCTIRCYAVGGTWIGNTSRLVYWTAVQL